MADVKVKKTILKPCPFCGGEAVLSAESICSGTVVCIGECGFKSSKFWDNMLIHEVEEKWYEKAAKVWNRRANDG